MIAKGMALKDEPIATFVVGDMWTWPPPGSRVVVDDGGIGYVHSVDHKRGVVHIAEGEPPPRPIHPMALVASPQARGMLVEHRGPNRAQRRARMAAARGKRGR